MHQQPVNQWYVITGGPSTGKTTTINELNRLGYRVAPEAARIIIDEAVARGITVDELRIDDKKFQEDIARLKQKIEGQQDPAELTFFDRGMHDTIGYLQYEQHAIEPWVVELMKASRYRCVFLLDPLPAFQKHYSRPEFEDRDYTAAMNTLFDTAYTEYGMKPIHVPALSVEERVQFILEHVATLTTSGINSKPLV